MKHYDYTTEGVCSRTISFDIDDKGCLHNVTFVGGCPGNTHGVATLCEGIEATRAMSLLKGIDCRNRGTSCPDQLARAIAKALS